MMGLVQAQTYDSLEYATGNLSAQQQLLSYPLPRFKPGHSLNRNFIWFGIEYFSGYQQPNVSRQQMVSNCKVNTEEFHNNWNYYFLVSPNIGSYSSAANYADTNNVVSAALTAVAKRNPGYKTSAICFWPQIGGNITNKNLSNNHYLKDASNQFLSTSGTVTTSKTWSPVAPASSIIADGQAQRAKLQSLVTALGRPLDILNENGECIPLISKNGVVVSSDPSIQADYNSLALPSVNDYRGYKYAYQTKLYRDQFMSASPGTKFTHYALDGQIDYRPLWNYAKTINTPINGKYYPTGDFYPRWPNNWKAWAGAWHGLGWFADCKYLELQNGDDLMSPFVSAGWNIDETVNVRPAQYLAMLKVLSAWGSEFFYSGYFSLAAPFPDSKNWGWQTVMPVYAQAITSRYENYLRSGTLLSGDVPRYFLSSTTLTPNNPKYLFYTGDNRQLVAVRKLNGVEKYVITTAQMVDANTINNAPMVSTGKFKLNNDSLNVEFRRQGSVYIYDASNPSAKVFYQLDGWHQYEHPERWSKDFQFEAELFDNSNSSAQIKTEVPAGTTPGDYRIYTSYVSFNVSTPPSLEYNFTPRAASNLYVWVRARSKNASGGAIGIAVSGMNSKSIGCITSTTWQWYSLDACSGQAISYNNLMNKQYILSLTASNSNIEIDRILLSGNSGLNLNPNQAACGTSVATVSPSGSTTFCQGGSVTLTAQSGTSYSWSNGQTTQSITVSQNGSFTVAVNNGSGCAAVSAPVNVTVNSAPTASITMNGSGTICQGQNITLTASPGSSFAWSNGASSQSIQVGSAGNYMVTVTNSNGCSATSSPVSINVTAAPSAVISNSGPTTFCQGGSVTLSAPSGYSYTWSNGSTSQQITVGNSGNYSVTVSAGANCSATSQVVAVTVNTKPVAGISASGTTSFCQGGSVQLTASGGVSYQWSTGQTGASITATSSGSYSAVVSSTNGCTAVTNLINVTVNAAPSPSITVNGPTALNTGQITTLTASGGTSYLWQPGGQTTASITVSSAGTYSVVATNAGGCTATSSPVTITQASSPTVLSISNTGNTSFCFGGNVVLTANGGTNYLWSPGGQTSATISASQAGTYYVYSRDNNGNVTDVDSVTVTVYPKPMNPSISITYIPNMAFQLNAFEPSAVTYQWSTGSASASINVTTPGLVSVTATNAFGCISGSTSMQAQGVNAKTCLNPDMLTSYDLSDTTAMLGWNPAITGERYIIRYWEAGTANIQMKEIAGTLSTLRINNLLPGTVYLWTAELVCTSGSYMSTTSSFKTLGTPLFCGSVPQHLRTDNITPVRAMVRWYNTTADSFVVRYRPVGASTFNYRRFAGNANATGAQLYSLQSNTNYEWQVNSTCNGYTSPFSPSAYFKTIDTCGFMGIVSVYSVSPSTASIRWSNLNPMDTIRIRLVDINTGGVRNIILKATTNTGSYELRGLKPNSTYYIELKGKCGGTAGSWTSPVTFSTGSISTRVLEGNNMNLNGFPNPVTDILFFSFTSEDNADYTVKVCDMSGRELMQEVRYANTGDNASEIPVNTYAKGAYLLIVQKGTQRSHFRFTVQ
ncbi:MAG: fibronectin type III domain-containing protein [Bacteroidia bacterium]|nr:fibronectin type III domain-containing protein [Bacteroidia bacterium]